jgi:hypothetical protein
MAQIEPGTRAHASFELVDPSGEFILYERADSSNFDQRSKKAKYAYRLQLAPACNWNQSPG